MLINTKYFGEVEINQDEVITFAEGIIGFPNEKDYVLIGQINLDSPFQFLQAVHDAQLCFIVMPPFFFCKEYMADLDDATVKELKITSEQDVMLYAITVVPEDVKQIRANLKAPLVINSCNHRAKQVILNNDNYRIKHYLNQAAMEPGKEEAASACSY